MASCNLRNLTLSQSLSRNPTFFCEIWRISSITISLLHCSWHMVSDGSYFALVYFLPFYTPKSPKNQNFLKMKKISGDMIILHMCTKNFDHVMYSSWYIVRDRRRKRRIDIFKIFSNFVHFCPNFQTFYSFLPFFLLFFAHFFAFFLKIASMPLLSRICPGLHNRALRKLILH